MPTTAPVQTRPGLVMRIAGRLLINEWVLTRVRHPDVRALLLQAANQIGRAEQFHRINAKLLAQVFRWDEPFPEGDYVSPGFVRVRLDACFPNLAVGDTNANDWDYLRRDSPHNWYVDSRIPRIGFVSRDEAHILYNIALQAAGKPALEIGCFLGWSTCHLALAGVQLDVVDPYLVNPTAAKSVTDSLTMAGVAGSCQLIPMSSPEAVNELAERAARRWNLIFVDGDHRAPAPVNDAIICERLAAEDCIVLFHDLMAPAVADGLRHFKAKGWNVRIYNTAQIMGVAWRGAMAPVDHVPDPRMPAAPAHLSDLI